MFYIELSTKQIVNPYITPLLSTSSINKYSPLNLNKELIQPRSPYKKYIYSSVFKISNSINNSVTQFSNKYYKPNEECDMLGKQRTGGINKYYLLNKNIKLPLEKKNEEIKSTT